MTKSRPTETSPALQDAWRELAAEHARVADALERALQEHHRLSLAEFEVLQRLAESAEGHRRMQELAEESPLSASALSRLMGRLERAGLGEREICDTDRRGIYACITEAGRAAQQAAEPTYRSVLADTFATPQPEPPGPNQSCHLTSV